jgi:hypothetical protein
MSALHLMPLRRRQSTRRASRAPPGVILLTAVPFLMAARPCTLAWRRQTVRQDARLNILIFLSSLSFFLSHLAQHTNHQSQHSRLPSFDTESPAITMATGRPSPSLVSYSRASSTAHDQASSASDIELVTLVPAVDNAVSEHPGQSSSVNLGATRRSTAAAAAYPTRDQTTRLRGDASSLQSDEPSWIR